MKPRTIQTLRWAGCLFVPMIFITLSTMNQPAWVGWACGGVWGVLSSLIAPLWR